MNQQNRNSILIVEADAVARRALAEALSGDGFTVLAAATGEEAIEILWRYKERVDWLFTSVTLPGVVTGVRVAEEFRFAHPLRAVVFASRGGPIDWPRGGPEALVMPKPYRPADVVAAFRRLRGDPGGTHCWPSVPFTGAESSPSEPKRSRCG